MQWLMHMPGDILEQVTEWSLTAQQQLLLTCTTLSAHVAPCTADFSCNAAAARLF
jgi:hypothetical protein